MSVRIKKKKMFSNNHFNTEITKQQSPVGILSYCIELQMFILALRKWGYISKICVAYIFPRVDVYQFQLQKQLKVVTHPPWEKSTLHNLGICNHFSLQQTVKIAAKGNIGKIFLVSGILKANLQVCIVNLRD